MSDDENSKYDLSPGFELLQDKKYVEAYDFAKEALEIKESFAAFYLLAKAMEGNIEVACECKEIQKMISYYQKAIEKNPDLSPNYLSCADAFHLLSLQHTHKAEHATNNEIKPLIFKEAILSAESGIELCKEYIKRFCKYIDTIHAQKKQKELEQLLIRIDISGKAI